MNTNSLSRFSHYCREVERTYATGQATENSYRPALQILIENLTNNNFLALNEPRRVRCGAPDFIVQESSGVPIGHVECKDVGVNLDHVETEEQLKRYREGLPNLILTDYLEFRWYVIGAPRKTVRLAHLNNRDKIAMDRTGAVQTSKLFNAFFETEPPTINNSSELVERMAAKARLLRDSIRRLLNLEDQSGPLHKLLENYREVLIPGLSFEDFADMQAQTAVYGLFAARCLHMNTQLEPFTRQSAVFIETTPFLREVFGHIAGPSADSGIAWIVDDLARMLNRADMETILAGFGRRTLRENPVVHFYENFLEAYDPDLRERRGVYYTPEPVVSYIVKSIDRLLRTRFSLRDGLADTTKIEIKATNGELYSGPRVIVLDPAVGTGTFLSETVSTIRSTIDDKGLAGAWRDYVGNHLLKRLFGFELLMAPYAICHLKLALEIGGIDTGFNLQKGQRLGIFLTNTLEEVHKGTTGALFAHEIAREASSADIVKREKPVMVILGNPPYSGHSANKGEWIENLMESYKQDPRLRKPGQAKWLSDDYVKFIRFAQWRIERTGEGILGFVTNHAYLDNPTFRDMRRSLMETFNEIYLLDLHGSARKKEKTPDGGKDENVFEIQQGVAIGIFIKRADASNSDSVVSHADLWGECENGPSGGKYGWLSNNHIDTTEWTELSPEPPFYFFVPRNDDEALSREYEKAWSIPDIFSRNSDPAPGIITTHDQFAISWTHAEAASKVEKLLATNSEEDARRIWRLCSQKQWQYDRAKKELSDGSWREQIKDILYRPFDMRVTVFDRNVAVHRRERVMEHMLDGSNLGLISCRQKSQIGQWSHCGITRSIIESCAISNKTKEINYLFPLYIYHEKTSMGMDEVRQPNLNREFLEAVSVAVGLEFIADGRGDLKTTFGPEDIFSYIYSVLHSPEYRNRYADFLKSDFPHIPLTTNPMLFVNLVTLGQRLVSLHLMEVEVESKDNRIAFPVIGSNRVDKVHYSPTANGEGVGQIWINSKQYFEGITPDVWDFSIGSYSPAEKWLKDRKGRDLSFDDIHYYCRVCAVLVETLQIMSKIDEIIVSNGVWSLA